MGLSNDERGWIMTSLSGVACVLGASIICVDIIIRQFPGKRDFKIQDSDSFLSASLSLSFGVMLFSALYSMLPSAKSSLMDAGYDAKTASWIMIACFMGGVIGIQILSRILHQFIPSHVVDCEHTHGEESDDHPKEDGHTHSHDEPHSHDHASDNQDRSTLPRSRTKSSLPGHLPRPPMQSTQSRQSNYFATNPGGPFEPTIETEDGLTPAALQRRPSLHQRLTAGLSRLTYGSRKDQCDSDGPCRGFSDLCGSECFKRVNAWGGTKAPPGSMRGTLRHSQSAQFATESTPLLSNIDEAAHPRTQRHKSMHGGTNGRLNGGHASHTTDAANHASSHPVTGHDDLPDQDHDSHSDDHDHEEQDANFHHHHVPTNAFLSIGLQTSIAIALHKLPEGFITYATNHANPQLGFSVFLALFIHNITEGFAMALPLYLAINSRAKAMFWSFVLGGLSQPLGAGVAALWFKLAGNSNWAPDEGVYGGMFAATAGIMASVALQLFSESLELTHSRTLCMIGAFSGMCILGISSALTA